MLGHVFEGETQRVAVSHSLSRRLRFHLEHGTPPNRAGKTSMSTAFPPRARNAVRPETGVRYSGAGYPTRPAYGLAAAGVQDSGTESTTMLRQRANAPGLRSDRGRFHRAFFSPDRAELRE